MYKRLALIALIVLAFIPLASAEADFDSNYFAYMHFTNGTDIPSDYVLGAANIDIKVDPIPIVSDKIGRIKTYWCSDPTDRTTCGIEFIHNSNWWNTYATLTTDTYKTSQAIANTSDKHFYSVFFVDDGYEGSNIFADVPLMYISRNSTIPVGPPTAGFTCNLNEGSYHKAPQDLICVSNSTANPEVTSIEWTMTYPDSSSYVTSNATLVRSGLSQLGWYGLGIKATNTQGSGYRNTTQMINLSATEPQATGISFWVHIYDPLKSAKIADSSLRVTNATYPAYYTNHYSTSGSYLITKTSGIDTISSGQSVNLTGSATGYETANQTVTVPYDGWEYILNLVATSDVPTGANATLVVNSINTYTAESIEGATITISNNTIPYSSSKLSNAGGSATFSSIPAGRYQISASKTGYQSSTTTWLATASTVTTAYIGLLPVGATPVVTGTAGNPLFDANGNPIVGYDANGNPITAAPTQDTRTSAEKDAGMADLLRNNGEALIMLFIVFTIIYMIKGIGK